MFDHDLKVVVIGGGTGLSTLLRGLKKYPIDITAVVAVSDDGGSSGLLREMFNMTPPGDIRRVLVSLSRDEELFDDLFNYRFNDVLDGHTVGNIILAALCEMNGGSMVKAIERLSKVLNIKGSVLPVSDEPYCLKAIYDDGTEIEGEKNIPCPGKRIINIMVKDQHKANPEVIKAIMDADAIIYSPGSLYTSLLPNLILPDIKKALSKSKAYKMYVANIVTQYGETNGYKLSDHVKALIDVIGKNQLDLVIANDLIDINKDILKKYFDLHQELVYPDIDKVNELGINVETSRLIILDGNNHLRHDANKIAAYVIKQLIDLM